MLTPPPRDDTATLALPQRLLPLRLVLVSEPSDTALRTRVLVVGSDSDDSDLSYGTVGISGTIEVLQANAMHIVDSPMIHLITLFIFIKR